VIFITKEFFSEKKGPCGPQWHLPSTSGIPDWFKYPILKLLSQVFFNTAGTVA
jgi:hypothetical protein